MTTTRIARRSLVVGFGLLLLAGTASAEERQTFHLTFVAGGLLAEIDTQSAKAEEYRDLSDGLLLDELVLELEREASSWSFELRGDNLGRQDARTTFALEREGRFRLIGDWNRIAHNLYNDASMIFAGAKGHYTLDNAFRTAMETLVSAPGSGTASAVRAALAAQSRSMDLGLQRDRAVLRADLRLTSFWDARAELAREERSGNDRISVGTYIRRQAVASDPTSGPNQFDRERVEPRGIELPKPIDATVDETELSTSLHGKKWLVDFGWEASSFDNDHNSLTWENPFEGDPGAASSNTGLVPGADQEPPAPAGNSGNRGRFTVAQLSLEPDNEFERANVSGALSLPGRTRIHAAFATATMKQDQSFLAYALNRAVLYSNGPDGVAGTPDDVRAADAPLAAPDLDGEVRTTRTDLRISSHPIAPLSLRARYGVYDYDDRSAAISWPGYAAAGDSYFRRNVGRRDAAGNKILINEVADYRRTVWGVGGGWRFGRIARLDVGYDGTEWEYEARQVESTNEDALSARLQLTPLDWLSARLTWLDSSREFSGAYVTGLETSGVRAFDVWNRDRERYGAEVDFHLGESTTFGLAWASWEDRYPGVVSRAPSTANPFPSQPYGLNETTQETISATLSWSAEKLSLTGSIGLDESSWESLMVSKTSLASDAVQFDPRNRWIRNQEDELIWASLGLEYEPADRWKLVADLFYQGYEGEHETVNPDVPNVNSGVAYPFPELSSEFFGGELTVEWEMSERLGFGLSYLYEPYSLDDFAWDVVEPYMQGVLRETGDSPSQVRDMTAYRLLWMDATYSDYTANVVRFFARVTF